MPARAAAAATALARLPVEGQASTVKPSSRAAASATADDAVLEGVGRVAAVVLDPQRAHAELAARLSAGRAGCSRARGWGCRARATGPAAGPGSARCCAGRPRSSRRVTCAEVVGDLERAEALAAGVERAELVAAPHSRQDRCRCRAEVGHGAVGRWGQMRWRRSIARSFLIFPGGGVRPGRSWHLRGRPRVSAVRRCGCRGFVGPFPLPLWMSGFSCADHCRSAAQAGHPVPRPETPERRSHGGRGSAGWRVRQVVNVVNLSTPLGLLVALVGGSRFRRGPDGLLLGTGFRIPVRGAGLHPGQRRAAAARRRCPWPAPDACSCTRRGTPRSTPAASAPLMLPLYLLAVGLVAAALRRPVVVQPLRGAGRPRPTAATDATDRRSVTAELLEPGYRREGADHGAPAQPPARRVQPRTPVLHRARRRHAGGGRGGGGLVSGLAGLTGSDDVVWVCAALSDGDRAAARRAPAAGSTVTATTPAAGGADARHRPARRSTAPTTASRTRRCGSSTTCSSRRRPRRHSTRASAGTGSPTRRTTRPSPRRWPRTPRRARVLVQDYHLTLAPAVLRELRPDLRIAHFSHTPWAPPEYYRMLPDDVGARDPARGILGADHAGFHPRAGRRPSRTAARGAAGRGRPTAATVTYVGRTTRLGVHPLGTDAEALRERGQPSPTSTPARRRCASRSATGG